MVGGMEEDVDGWVAGGELALDLFVEVVCGVFGFPEAVDQGEVVYEGSVSAEGLFGGAFELVLLYEVPGVGGGAALEEVGEGGTGVAFRGVAVVQEPLEGGVVGLDWSVSGLEGEESHERWLWLAGAIRGLVLAVLFDPLDDFEDVFYRGSGDDAVAEVEDVAGGV